MLVYCRSFCAVRNWRQFRQPMASNRSMQQEEGGGECVDKEQQDTSGVTYPPHAFKVVSPEVAAGKISLTSLVMALALIGNCLVVTTVWRCRRVTKRTREQKSTQTCPFPRGIPALT